jgi:hypothetical protein
LVASAAAEAESGSSDGGHPVRQVLMLMATVFKKHPEVGNLLE